MLVLLTLLPLALASPFRRQTNSTTPSSASAPTVTIIPSTSGGKGVELTGIAYPAYGQDVYLGIPFARPPVGDLRWSPPQDAIYNSTFEATTLAPACLQQASSGSIIGNPNSAFSYNQSEDCLRLNVFTPQGTNGTSAYLPVMVWVYGGSFQTGAASIYNATALVAQGVLTKKPFIFVAVNYRLGVLGFPYGQEAAANGAANLGLKDVIKSLTWVQENIWAFGGDPSKGSSVTVFGQSAGAILISLLYLNPEIKLFKSAIMESGGQSTAPIGPTATTWQKPFDLIAQATNCSSGASNDTQNVWQCLKYLPAQQLLAAQEQVLSSPLYGAAFVFAPSIDGDLIPASPHTLLSQGKFAKIPFISGNNADEGTLFVPSYVNNASDIALYLEIEEPIPPSAALIGQLEQLYPADPAAGSPFNSGNETFGLSPVYKRLSAIAGDGTFQQSSYLFAEHLPVPGQQPYLGSYHSSELSYVFGIASPDRNFTQAQQQLSRQMVDYWINFAYYTDPSAQPNVANGTTWPAYGTKANMLQLGNGNNTVITDDYREKEIAFFWSEAQSFNLRRRDVV